jgi:hypothetical protein
MQGLNSRAEDQRLFAALRSRQRVVHDVVDFGVSALGIA